MIHPKKPLGTGKTAPSTLITVEQVIEHMLRNQVDHQELLEQYGLKLNWLEKRMLTVRRCVPRVQLPQLETRTEVSETQIDQLKIQLEESQARSEALEAQNRALRAQIRTYETDLITLEDDFQAKLEAHTELIQAKFERLKAKMEALLAHQRSDWALVRSEKSMVALEEAFQKMTKSADLKGQQDDSFPLEEEGDDPISSEEK